VYAIFYPPLYRTIGREPDVREDGSHINVNETIDASVFERWRADPTYRPANLVEWAQRKKVDPAQSHTSVRADDPRVVVPEQ
jgi:DNA gyrase inhibitor GyrI